MISASPTGRATLSILAWPAIPMAISAFRMPMTVPNRPTKGAVDPTVARNARPSESLLLTRSVAHQRHGDPLVQIDAIGEPSLVVRGRSQPVFGDEAEVIALGQALHAVLDRGRGPELLLHKPGRLLHVSLVPHLCEDDEPGAERHNDQDDQGGARDHIAVNP